MQKLIVSSMIGMLVIFGWGTMSRGEQAPAPRGELRIVDTHPGNWASVTLHVFEHLLELDKDGKLVPRLATSWQWRNDRTLDVTLRQGITFQNGEVFDAEIVKLNWEENTRLGQPHISGAFMNFTPGSRLEILDAQTVRFIFPEPDGAALAKLSACISATASFIAIWAGARSTGESSMALARGARARTS
jgi:ABC-type transport system substrate-binding protein